MIDEDTLFRHADNIEPGWWVAQPSLDACAKKLTEVMPVHPAESSGQSKADSALRHYSQRWCTIKGARARGSS
jgi:glucose-6-phosphate 1-dehydrogenase